MAKVLVSQNSTGLQKPIESENTPKHRLLLAFLLMGFSFSVTQTLMARELMVSFSGNELSIGLVLGSWLILEAVGSGVLGRLAERTKTLTLSYAALQAMLSLLLPLSLYLAFALRILSGVLPGEGIGLMSTIAYALLVLLPLGLVDGAMFAFGCRAYAREVSAVGQVYALEAIGGIIGGVVFTYLFIPYLQPVQVVLVLAAMNLASALTLVVPQGPKLTAVILGLLVVSLYLLLPPQASNLHHWLVSQQWRGYNLAYYGNSIYGNVAAIEQEKQYTFFANGVPIITAPVPDIVFVEELVHLPMLFIPQPRRVLVLSGGVGGLLTEILKYPVERVDYAELDPLLIEAVKSLPTPLTTAELTDPRVHIRHVDGRLLTRQMATEGTPAGRYDLIIVNLPYPSTLQLNRFYSQEFFALVQAILADEGVMVLTSPSTLTHMSPGMRDLNASLYLTLGQVFPHIRSIPGDVCIWLASPTVALEDMPQGVLIARWRERAIPSRMMSDFHISLKLDERRLDRFLDSLQRTKRAMVNRDLQPAGLLYGLAYWSDLFSPRFSRYFESLGKLDPLHLAALLIAATIGLLIAGRFFPRIKETAVPIAIVTTGFGGMAFDLLVIFAFQIFYGYVYYQIGLLITAFMAGLSVGGLVMTHRVSHTEAGKRTLIRAEGALAGYWILFPAIVMSLYAQAHQPRVATLVGPVLLALNALTGFLVGLEFPLANKMYLRESLSRTAGILYAADLLGAFLGALLVSIVLLPALGVLQTCALMALLKLGSLTLVSNWADSTRQIRTSSLANTSCK